MIESVASKRSRSAALALVSLGAIGVFVAASRGIDAIRGQRLDRKLIRSAGKMRSPTMNVVARAVTSFGGVPGAIIIAVGAVFLARRKPREAFQLGIGAIGGVGAEFGLKQMFGRTRPTHLPHLERVTSKSFPSGHAMASAALYLTLAFVGSREKPQQRGTMLVGAGAVASMIGLSRVYLGVHWPTDVLGGLALGTAWASAVEAGFDYAALTPEVGPALLPSA